MVTDEWIETWIKCARLFPKSIPISFIAEAPFGDIAPNYEQDALFWTTAWRLFVSRKHIPPIDLVWRERKKMEMFTPLRQSEEVYTIKRPENTEPLGVTRAEQKLIEGVYKEAMVQIVMNAIVGAFIGDKGSDEMDLNLEERISQSIRRIRKVREKAYQMLAQKMEKETPSEDTDEAGGSPPPS